MASIRQEINLINTQYSSTGTVAASEKVVINTNHYGTATYYLEILYSGAASNTGTIKLTNTDTNSDVLSVAGSTSGTLALSRTSFTPTTGWAEYNLRLVGDGTRNQVVKAARVIIIQTVLPLSYAESHFEIGSTSSISSASYVALTNPKYWKYTASDWSSLNTAYIEATGSSSSTANLGSVKLQVADGTGDGFTGWADVVTSTFRNSTPYRVRQTFTPVDGRNYRLVGASPSGTMTVHNAQIIITQGGPYAILEQFLSLVTIFGFGNSATTSNRLAQSFYPRVTGTLNQVITVLRKVGTPTDNITLDIATSLTGAALATSNAVSGSTLNTTNTTVTFTFASPPSLTAGTQYFLRIRRATEPGNATNNYVWMGSNGSLYPYGDGYISTDAGVSYSLISGNTCDMYFVAVQTLGTAASINNLKEEYLLANTLLAAGTSLQNFLTKWDSTEWQAGVGTINYQHSVDAADNDTSNVELQTVGGVTLSGSQVKLPDNNQTSGTVTMPATGNIDVIATTNSGAVYASRLLVTYAYVFRAPFLNYIIIG